MSEGPNLIAISVGNTRTAAGQFVKGELKQSERFGNEDLAPMVQRIAQWWREIADSPGTGISDDEYFISLIRQGKGPEIPLSHAVDSVRVIEAVHASLTEKRSVRLEEICSA